MGSESEMDAVVGQALVAQEIRRYRERAGLSLNALAARVGYSRTYISASEKPGATLISANVVRRIDDELGAGGALIALHARADANRQNLRLPAADASAPSQIPRSANRDHHRNRDVSSTANAVRSLPCSDEDVPLALQSMTWTDSNEVGALPGAQGPLPGPFDCAAHIVGVLDPEVALDAIDNHVESLVSRYEIEGPRLLQPEALALRGLCRDLGGRSWGQSRRTRTASVGARISGLLSYMSVNLDRAADAQAFAFEAGMLATAARDRELLAWIKGTQSFAAYYQGRFDDALRHAHAGLHIAGPESPQRIRLLTNGVARAAGKLGDVDAVRIAIDGALCLAGEPDAGRGLGPCISFAPYTHARAIANAATAYLAVGRYGDVLSVWSELEPSIEMSDSDDWSRALVALDVASALARDAHMDANHAADVGVRALDVSRSNPIVSIARRGAELADDLRHSRARHAAETFDSALRDWRGHVDNFAQ